MPGDYMSLKKKMEDSWIVLAVIFAVFISSTTYAVLNVLVIQPLKDQSSGPGLPGFETKNLKPSDATITPMNEPAAGALILQCRDNLPAMLGVLHSENGHLVFSPPGGGSNDDESPEDTAIRETYEETGYTIIAERFIENSPSGNTKFSLVLAKIDDSAVANPYTNEVVGLLWSDPNDIPKKSWRFPEQRRWIVELYEQYANSICLE